MRTFLCCALFVLTSGVSLVASAEVDGFLRKGEARLFPIGFYELPEDNAALRAMAEGGVNLVRCRSAADLDRVHALGMQGVMPLPFQNGATDELRERVEELAQHPALAVWEGPDEVVWNFTAYSGLYRTMGIHTVPGAWWKQTTEAVAYAEEKAAEIIPNMRAAVDMIREIDRQARPVWINEALDSDVAYVRQYLDYVDITGCDTYPVRAGRSKLASIGTATDRWNAVGRGRPVYMVLQAFSWDELGDYYGATETVYPTFDESRFMAYSAIVHGADGVLYWGSHKLKSDAFRQSLYALTSELAALQPFLVQPDAGGAGLEVVETEEAEPNVHMAVRQAGGDWLVILVNEDNDEHMGVVVNGLDALDGRTMYELHGPRKTSVRNGELVGRMMALEVQVFATDRKWETGYRDGREFRGNKER